MAKMPTSVDVLACDASPSSESCSHEVSVRKVDNGYVRRESTYNGTEYTTRETVHTTNPGLVPGGRAEGQNGRGTLRDAIKTCS